MSATLDASLFSRFFSSSPVLNIPGRTFPVNTYFLEDLLEATDHVIEDHSPYAMRMNYNDSNTTRIKVTTKGGEQRNVAVSIDSEVALELTDDFAGYKYATRW
jgi:hypothetical protein